MLNDFDMIVHRFDDAIDIYPIADVHLGAMECAEREWASFIKKVKAEHAYLILDGDLLNNGIRTCNFVNPFDEALRPREAKKRMTEYLEPVKDQILCVLSGNHERRTYKDDDQDLCYDICARLAIEDLYRENIAFMKIGMGSRTNGNPRTTYSFVVTHGSGGGIYTGATVNRNERFGNIFENMDCLVVGHTHKGIVSKPQKIVINTDKENVKVTTYTQVSCVSWLNYGGYAAQKMLLPAAVCDPQVIHLGGAARKRITTEW